MKYFLYRLNPPRPTVTTDQLKLVEEHVLYLDNLMNLGLVIAFGPVDDPKGSYGVGIIQLQDDVDPNSIGVNDPAIKANLGFDFEIYPMPTIMLREHRV